MLDLNKLHLMDCMEGIKEIPKIDLVITDPPYPNAAGHFNDQIFSATSFMAEFNCDHWFIFWDEMSLPPMNIPLVAKHIWHRSNTNRPDNYEVIYEYHIDGKKRASRVLSYSVIYLGLTGCKEATGHPTQKNLKLIKKLIHLSNEDGIILDPFMGSGTTAIAAIDEGRDWIGFEIDEDYHRAATKRIEIHQMQTKLF